MQWLKWQHQLCNGQGGSNDNNGNNDNGYNVETTTTTAVSMMVAGSIGINAGMDAAAALCQGLKTQGKLVKANINVSILQSLALGHRSEF